MSSCVGCVALRKSGCDCQNIRKLHCQESERRLRDLLAGKKPQGGGGGGGDAAAVAPSVGNKKSVAARGSQMQLFQARLSR